METIAIVSACILFWIEFCRNLNHGSDSVMLLTSLIAMTTLVTGVALIAHASIWITYLIQLPSWSERIFNTSGDQLGFYSGRYFIIIGSASVAINLLFSSAFYYIFGTLFVFSVLSAAVSWQFSYRYAGDAMMLARFPEELSKQQKKQLLLTSIEALLGIATILSAQWRLYFTYKLR